jgi:hypothetical protein
MQEEYNPLLKN